MGFSQLIGIMIEKIKEKIIQKNTIYIMLSFLIPIIVLAVIFFIKGARFDGEALSFGDMQAQYSSLIVYFRQMLQGSESIYYSINKGLGGDMYSTFAYYMLSPFNFITLFFDIKNIMSAIFIIILLKFGMCGLTMYILLNYKNNKNKLMSLLFSVCYALMAFTVDSYFCIMWLDTIYMAPLVILGIEKLIEKQNILFYIITLFLAISFNYLIGYMLCIFCVIYFIYRVIYLKEKGEKLKIGSIISKFIMSSLIAGLLSAVVWMPSILEILKTNRNIQADNTTVLKLIKSFLIGSYTPDDMLSYHRPNIYCGIFALVAFVLFLSNKKRTILQKVSAMLVFGFFVASVMFRPLSFVWHGFSYPIGYNFRFTFLLSMFLIIVAYEEFGGLKRISRIQTIILVLLFIVLAIFVKLQYNNAYGWLSAFLILIYAVILRCNLKAAVKRVLVFFICIIEIVINVNASVYLAKNMTTYTEYIDNICRDDNKNFYRMAEYNYYGVDSMIGCGISTTKGFYSTLNNNISDFYIKIGYSGGANIYEANQEDTPIINSLLGVKYIFYNKKLGMYDLIDTVVVDKTNPDTNEVFEERNYVYENPNALSLGYVIKSTKNDFKYGNSLEYENQLIKTISGIEKDVVKKIVLGKENKGLSKSKYIYVLPQSNSEFLFNGVKYKLNTAGAVTSIENDLKSDSAKEDLTDAMAYYVDEDALSEAFNNLKQNQLKKIKINKNIISGEIDSSEDGVLMLSVPYERGWKIYVDGKKVKYSQLYDMFIGIDLKKGSHKIKMIYSQNTVVYGLILSIFTLFVAIIYVCMNIKELKEGEKNGKREKNNKTGEKKTRGKGNSKKQKEEEE